MIRESNKTKHKTFFYNIQTYLPESHFLCALNASRNLSLKDKDKATSCTQSSATASQRPSSAKPSSAKQENPLLSGLGGNRRASQESKKIKVYFYVFNVLVGSIYRTGGRPGTITNPECTLDAIFTLLTPGLHRVCKLMSYLCAAFVQ